MPEAKEFREGDWQCPNAACVNHTDFPQHYVYGAKVNCPKCCTGKFAQRAGDWCCPNPACLNHRNTVYGSKPQCTKCGAAKPLMNAQPAGTASQNQQYQHQPLQSSQPPPPSTPHPYYGVMFGQPAAGPPGTAGNCRAGDWHCPNPSCKNHTGNLVYGTKSQCPLCSTPRPEQNMTPQAQAFVQTAMPQQPQMSVASQMPRGGNWPGDWHCPNQACKNHTGNLVFASKSTCPLCNAPKPATLLIGTRQGDWQCPNPACKNHMNLVYGSKSSCNICGTPNPRVGKRERSRSPMGAGFGP
mmetsp:Transcript_56385/g.132226  ORF Transcript_56385/g.132226 Transcript_56385/m.132226 type:complete len:298 (-) Transcript_56385:68-961(-)